MIRDIILLELAIGCAFISAWALATRGLPLFEPARPRWIVVGLVFMALGIASLIGLVGIPQRPNLPTHQSDRT